MFVSFPLSDAAAIPLPKLDTTPPVKERELACEVVVLQPGESH